MLKIYYVDTNERTYFYELSQQLKQLKTTEVDEARLDI